MKAVMTQEEKELLLKDLSARLPYGVFCNMGLNHPLPLQRLFVDKVDGILLDFYEGGKNYQVYLSEVKPYLRPMSSMTEEEYNVVYNGHVSFWAIEDYCNKHHLDYRGLIEKGLALKAHKGMYNTKEKVIAIIIKVGYISFKTAKLLKEKGFPCGII